MRTEITQKDILDRLSPDFPVVRRELVRYFQHRRDQFKKTYAELLDSGQIAELGSGRPNDPVLVYLERPDVELVDYSKVYPFVTKIPRPVWTEFVANCVIAGREPEDVLAAFLAIPVPTKSQNVDRGY